jgi:hypothetical protein
MATDIRLVSSIETLYLVNSTGVPVAGGSPTAAATTPFMLELDWTPQAPPQIYTMIGGQPFGVGSRPLYRGYDNVKEAFTLTIVASSANNAADLLQRIRRAASTSLLTFPPFLQIQPNGASNAIGFEIYRLDIQEIVNLRSPAEGFTILRAKIEIERHPFGGWTNTASLENVVNNITLTNTCCTGTSHYTAFATGTGDMIYEGGPLNANIQTNGGATTLWAATIKAREIQSSGSLPLAMSTSGTSLLAINFSPTLTNSSASVGPSYNVGTRFRIMARITSPTANLQVRARVFTYNSHLVYQGSWVTPGTATPNLIDLGGYDTSMLVLENSLYVYVYLDYRSSTGAAATGTLTACEIVQYYAFAKGQISTGTTLWYLESYLSPANGAVNRPQLPFAAAQLWPTGSGTSSFSAAGTPPVYIASAYLWVAWLNYSNQQDTTATMTVTANHGPLFKTLRGTS